MRDIRCNTEPGKQLQEVNNNDRFYTTSNPRPLSSPYRNDVVTMLIATILLIIYFIPSLFAWSKTQSAGVFVLNLFLGWTGIFWVISLAWAVCPSGERG